jgi:hypothetical protein
MVFLFTRHYNGKAEKDWKCKLSSSDSRIIHVECSLQNALMHASKVLIGLHIGEAR